MEIGGLGLDLASVNLEPYCLEVPSRKASVSLLLVELSKSGIRDIIDDATISWLVVFIDPTALSSGLIIVSCAISTLFYVFSVVFILLARRLLSESLSMLGLLFVYKVYSFISELLLDVSSSSSAITSPSS